MFKRYSPKVYEYYRSGREFVEMTEDPQGEWVALADAENAVSDAEDRATEARAARLADACDIGREAIAWGREMATSRRCYCDDGYCHDCGAHPVDGHFEHCLHGRGLALLTRAGRAQEGE